MRYKITFLAWRKGKKWRLAWNKGGERTERYFSTEREAKAYVEQKTAHVGRERQRIVRVCRGAKRSASSALTVDGLLDAYLARDGIREITRKADTYHAVHLRHLFGHRRAARLTEADARAFMTMQRERGLRQTTVNRRVKILRAAYNWAVREGLLRTPSASCRPRPPSCARFWRWPRSTSSGWCGLATAPARAPAPPSFSGWHGATFQNPPGRLSCLARPNVPEGMIIAKAPCGVA